MPEIGIVETYFPEAGFGFIRTADEERIFFDFYNGRIVENDGNQPVFSTKSMSRPSDRAAYAAFPEPKRGTLVVFARYRKTNDEKEKAFPWAYYSQWKHWQRWDQTTLNRLHSLPLKELFKEGRKASRKPKRKPIKSWTAPVHS